MSENNVIEEKIESKSEEIESKPDFEAEKEKFLRIIADYENKMKRSKFDAIHSINTAIENIILDFTPIIDDMKKAYESADNNSKVGINLIIKNMLKILSKYGVEEIIPEIGQKINYELHQALATKDSEKEEETIIEVLQSGYKFKNKTISYAQVIISNNKN